jgi:hypothetical protein
MAKGLEHISLAPIQNMQILHTFEYTYVNWTIKIIPINIINM